MLIDLESLISRDPFCTSLTFSGHFCPGVQTV